MNSEALQCPFQQRERERERERERDRESERVGLHAQQFVCILL